MPKHQRLFLSLALSALIGLLASEARAETISMTISLGGGATFNVDTLTNPLLTKDVLAKTHFKAQYCD